MRCGICGSENAEANLYCGMCGAALVEKTPPAGQAPTQRVAAVAPRQSAVPVQPAVPRQAPQSSSAGVAGPGRVSADVPPRSGPGPSPRLSPQPSPRPNDAPTITGPSFLGLNVPGPARSEAGYDSLNRDSLHRDPLRTSRSVDYLLEDDEEPSRGWGKLIVVVIALALAVGFGYLRWKQGGFDWLYAGDKKPAATTAQTGSAESSTNSGGGTAPTAAPDATASGGTPTAGTPGQSSPASGADSASQTTPPAAAGASASATESPATNPPQTNPPPATGSQTAAPSSASVQSAPSQSAPSDSNPPADSAAQPADSESKVQASQEEKPAAARPRERERKPTPAKPVDPVSEAERYIYGRGVRQDCDHGMRMLKPAAEQSNPKAMISLGALYSTGTCTPRDLPTAYRWFALALHKQPDNQPLQEDLQKLWSQMTQPERQLAIKLSQ